MVLWILLAIVVVLIIAFVFYHTKVHKTRQVITLLLKKINLRCIPRFSKEKATFAV